MWVTQAQVNRGQGRLQERRLVRRHALRPIEPRHPGSDRRRDGPKALVETDRAAQPSQPSPQRCRDLVATINGSTLYVLNRYTGDILYQTTINGAPGGGPALSSKRAYVPHGLRHDPRLSAGADHRRGQGTRQDRSPCRGHVGRGEERSGQEGRGRTPREHPHPPGLRAAAGLQFDRAGPWLRRW